MGQRQWIVVVPESLGNQALSHYGPFEAEMALQLQDQLRLRGATVHRISPTHFNQKGYTSPKDLTEVVPLLDWVVGVTHADNLVDEETLKPINQSDAVKILEGINRAVIDFMQKNKLGKVND